MNVPYIGVTDFASHAQVLEAVACIPESVERRLHVGVMMSYKTLNGIPTSTGWEKIWPDENGLREIFQPHSRTFNVLHYADYGEPCPTTAEDLIRAVHKADPYVQGLQLDMVWPQADMLREVNREFPNLEIILQVGKKALEQLEHGAGLLNEETSRYLDCVDYFLIDWSMGQGKPMDARAVMAFMEDLAQKTSYDHIAVAGGLGPHTYSVLEEFFRVSNMLSCDAQGQMRSSGKATDPIEMDRVCAYIKGVCSLL